MCKDRTTKWGFGKRVKRKEYEAIIEDQSRRESNGAVWIRGRLVKQRDVDRYVKRRRPDPAGLHLDPAENGAQTTESTPLRDQEITIHALNQGEPDVVLSNSWKLPDEGDVPVQCAVEHLASPEDGSIVLDKMRKPSLLDQNDLQCPVSLDALVSGDLLFPSLLTPSWPASPVYRSFLRDESECSFADSVYGMGSILKNNNTEDALDSTQDKAITLLLPAHPCRDDESLAPPSKTPVPEEVSDVASRWIAFCSLAAMQTSYGKFEVLRHALHEASMLFEEMISTDDPQLLSSIVIFGSIMEAHGKDDSVRTLLSHTHEISSNIFGPSEFITITIGWIIDALAKDSAHRARVSLSKLREISYAFESKYGKQHPYYLTSLFNLAKALDLEEYVEEAEPILQDVVKRCSQVFAHGHPQTIIAQMNMARVSLHTGKCTAAESIMTSAVSSSQARWGADHPYTLECLRRQAILLGRLGKSEEVEKLLEKVLKGRISSLGPGHRFVYGSRLDLECWLEDQGKGDEAQNLETKMAAWATEAHHNDMKDGLAAY